MPIVASGIAVECLSTNGERRVDEGPNGFMCWRRVRSFPDVIPEDSPFAYHYEQGGYTKDRVLAERWLAGEDVLSGLIRILMTTSELTPRMADAFWPYLAPHREAVEE